MTVILEVLGVPAPQGSKRAFVRNGKAVMIEANHRTRPWRQEVAGVAESMLDEPMQGALFIELVFRMPRPKGHYRTGKRSYEVRAEAPDFVSSKPDIDKLVRAILDALTGIAFVDDSQIAVLEAQKRYCYPSEAPGVSIMLREAGK